ncbi:MAG: potassium channel family protein [Deltaproteobacteria bacterium]|jgi:voltage-gated potassium channel|nr:potassium channel family protein [Deltaproteobacteria bacterium]
MLKLLTNLFQIAHYKLSQRWFVIMFFLFSIITYSATGFMYFELSRKPNLEWVDAFWWSIVTTTTVGYGDYFPETFYGKVLVGLPTMLLGVSILGYLLSYVASAIMESKLKEMRGMKSVSLTDHIIICRYNSIGRILNLVNEIKEDVMTLKTKVVLIDEELEEIPQELYQLGIHFVKGDPARENILKMANFKQSRSIIVPAIENDLINSDHRNLAVVLSIERLHPPCKTVVECVNPENEIFFKRAGCDSVITLAALTNQILVQELLDPGVHSVISELTSNVVGNQIYIVDINEKLKNYGELRKKYAEQKSSLLGIRRGHENIFLPGDSFSLQKKDKLILVSKKRPGSLF